jgi:hypothetical protein
LRRSWSLKESSRKGPLGCPRREEVRSKVRIRHDTARELSREEGELPDRRKKIGSFLYERNRAPSGVDGVEVVGGEKGG